MIAFLRLTIVLAALSCLVHIFTILTLPYFAKTKVWTRITSAMNERSLTPIDDYPSASGLLGLTDPAMIHAICWFDIENEPVQIKVGEATEFWNVTIYDEYAEVLYSLHDGASRDGKIDLKILNRNQRKALQEAEPDPSSGLEEVSTSGPDNPPPRPRPLAQSETRITTPEEEEEEDLTITARLNVSRAFAVVKIFRPHSVYDQIISDVLDAAECQ